MNISQALENITHLTCELPEAEVFCIRAHREEAIPTLLEYVKTIADLGEDISKDYEAHTLAMYLLAEFRVNEAFPYLIRFLEFDHDFVDWLLDDTLCEDFGQIIASVAQAGDIPRIHEVAENEKLNSFHRFAAAKALNVLYLEGVYSRENYFACLGKLLESTDMDFLSLLVSQCADVGARELMPAIEKHYENGQIDEFLAPHEEIVEQFDISDNDPEHEKLKADRYNTLINDTIDRIESWICYRDEPYEEPRYEAETTYVRSAPKVGRNDPCPCGSGKKYKKCCGK